MEQTCSCGARLSGPYDAGYNLGWNDARAGKRTHRRLRLGYSRAASLAEARLGYAHGRLDGVGRAVDWWPAYAHGAHFFVRENGTLTSGAGRKSKSDSGGRYARNGAV